MKLNTIPSLIALIISALIAYSFYHFHTGENKDLLSLGSFIFIAITLLFLIGIRYTLPRTTTMIATVSGIFFVLSLISNLTFSFSTISTPLYVIVNGILMMVYLYIVYSVQKAKQ
jgi:hypothetical protein